MPDYEDEWIALFYAVWYQPAHINLAYTLAHRIPKESNPLLTGEGSLRVFDYGCGALAMKFGLLIARLECAVDQNKWVSLSIKSRDSSGAMVSIGKKIMAVFRQDFLDGFTKRATPKTLRKRKRSRPSVQWVTALHVAYKQNIDQVKISLDEVVHEEGPKVVLVTTHEGSSKALYSPESLGYELGLDQKGIRGGLHGNHIRLQEVSAFRNGLAELPGLATQRLLKTKTTWNNKLGDSIYRFYLRDVPR